MHYEKNELCRKWSSIDSCDGYMYSKTIYYILVESDVFPEFPSFSPF